MGGLIVTDGSKLGIKNMARVPWSNLWKNNLMLRPDFDDLSPMTFDFTTLDHLERPADFVYRGRTF